MLKLEFFTAADCIAADTKARHVFAEKLLRMQNYRDVPLLLGTEIRQFECLESILFQAAKNNGMTSIAPLLLALDLPRRGVLNPKRHMQLSHSLLADGDQLAVSMPTVPSIALPKGSTIYGGHRLRRDQLALTTSRICPTCVQENGYGHSWWALAPLAYCDVHGTRLIDHCPSCVSPISVTRPAYDMCRCGMKLSSKPTTQANFAAQALAQLIAARFKKETCPPNTGMPDFFMNQVSSLELGALLDLVTFFGALSSNAGTVRLRKLKGVVHLDHAKIGFDRAVRIMSKWPGDFYAELRCARAFFPKIDTQSNVAKSLDHIIQLATGSLRQREQQFIVAEIARFLASPDEWSEERKLAADFKWRH